MLPRVPDGNGFMKGVMGPGGAIYFLLNWMEKEAAQAIYANWGVSRSYLVTEAQYLMGSSSGATLADLHFFFGLRVEL